eukprot:Gregarina_sp_Poly_1__2800@NODE_177_length_11964_cov_73_622174_g157_i0_p1_GENE_NODE_177_length_11964_cov_73_622174_g157_i0NODE_177_length_11964_cov_73_622174_g157_i0_p1_ORF_typecomplete_len1199_score214_99_NODE_177_length_11964_cov_73_622174_g157_i050658661
MADDSLKTICLSRCSRSKTTARTIDENLKLRKLTKLLLQSFCRGGKPTDSRGEQKRVRQQDRLPKAFTTQGAAHCGCGALHSFIPLERSMQIPTQMPVVLKRSPLAVSPYPDSFKGFRSPLQSPSPCLTGFESVRSPAFGDPKLFSSELVVTPSQAPSSDKECAASPMIMDESEDFDYSQRNSDLEQKALGQAAVTENQTVQAVTKKTSMEATAKTADMAKLEQGILQKDITAAKVRQKETTPIGATASKPVMKDITSADMVAMKPPKESIIQIDITPTREEEKEDITQKDAVATKMAKKYIAQVDIMDMKLAGSRSTLTRAVAMSVDSALKSDFPKKLTKDADVLRTQTVRSVQKSEKIAHNAASKSGVKKFMALADKAIETKSIAAIKRIEVKAKSKSADRDMDQVSSNQVILGQIASDIAPHKIVSAAIVGDQKEKKIFTIKKYATKGTDLQSPKLESSVFPLSFGSTSPERLATENQRQPDEGPISTGAAQASEANSLKPLDSKEATSVSLFPEANLPPIKTIRPPKEETSAHGTQFSPQKSQSKIHTEDANPFMAKHLLPRLLEKTVEQKSAPESTLNLLKLDDSRKSTPKFTSMKGTTLSLSPPASVIPTPKFDGSDKQEATDGKGMGAQSMEESFLALKPIGVEIQIKKSPEMMPKKKPDDSNLDTKQSRDEGLLGFVSGLFGSLAAEDKTGSFDRTNSSKQRTPSANASMDLRPRVSLHMKSMESAAWGATRKSVVLHQPSSENPFDTSGSSNINNALGKAAKLSAKELPPSPCVSPSLNTVSAEMKTVQTTGPAKATSTLVKEAKQLAPGISGKSRPPASAQLKESQAKSEYQKSDEEVRSALSLLAKNGQSVRDGTEDTNLHFKSNLQSFSEAYPDSETATQAKIPKSSQTESRKIEPENNATRPTQTPHRAPITQLRPTPISLQDPLAPQSASITQPSPTAKSLKNPLQALKEALKEEKTADKPKAHQPQESTVISRAVAMNSFAPKLASLHKTVEDFMQGIKMKSIHARTIGGLTRAKSYEFLRNDREATERLLRLRTLTLPRPFQKQPQMPKSLESVLETHEEDSAVTKRTQEIAVRKKETKFSEENFGEVCSSAISKFSAAKSMQQNGRTKTDVKTNGTELFNKPDNKSEPKQQPVPSSSSSSSDFSVRELVSRLQKSPDTNSGEFLDKVYLMAAESSGDKKQK